MQQRAIAYPNLQPVPTSSRHGNQTPASTLQTLDSTKPLRIVAVGDSLVYGFGDPDGGGWVERLRRRWMTPDSPGHIVYNLGIRGDGVRQVAHRIEAEFSKRGELRHQVPDVILLSIGTNDSARVGRATGRPFTPFDEFEADLHDLLEDAHRLCPVLFVGMPPVNEAQMPFAGLLHYTHADQFHYKEATRRACNAHHIPYLDIFDRWQQRGQEWCNARLCPDGLHPNPAGYQALLQEFLAWDCGISWETHPPANRHP